jgi:hypothetical protein
MALATILFAGLWAEGGLLLHFSRSESRSLPCPSAFQSAGPDVVHRRRELYPFVFFLLGARSNACAQSSNTSTNKVVDWWGIVLVKFVL